MSPLIRQTKPRRLTNIELVKLAGEAADRAAPVFKAMGWTYGGSFGAEAVVPDHKCLMDTALRLLVGAGEDDSSGTRCSGRLVAERWIDEPENEEAAHVCLILGDTYD